jgi:hypothetical protein
MKAAIAGDEFARAPGEPLAEPWSTVSPTPVPA